MKAWGLALLLAGSAACESATGPNRRSLAITPAGPLLLEAVGDSVSLEVVVRKGDSLVSLPVILFTAADPRIVAVSREGVVRGLRNGTTWIVARERYGAADSVAVAVRQAVDSLEVAWTDSSAIFTVLGGGPLPLTCIARDRNGFRIADAAVPSSARGTVTGSTCETLVAVRSGFDMVTITAGEKSITLPPFALGLVPQASSAAGEFVSLDSFPTGYRMWAPSARVNTQGATEVYLTGYQLVPDSNGVGPGALHRLASDDGASFRYDGVVFDLPQPGCDLVCSGYENIAVIPRDDGPGWRMFVAAGSTGHLWLAGILRGVHGRAVTWTMEPGIRIANGGPLPPAP